jgi:hypothetical protein
MATYEFRRNKYDVNFAPMFSVGKYRNNMRHYSIPKLQQHQVGAPRAGLSDQNR